MSEASSSGPWGSTVCYCLSGSYSVYRALAAAAGQLSPGHVPDLSNTAPAEALGPHPNGSIKFIVSLDPFGHMVSEMFQDDPCRVCPTLREST